LSHTVPPAATDFPAAGLFERIELTELIELIELIECQDCARRCL
jgi:hypothetical protein